jgi:hypothetical protein
MIGSGSGELGHLEILEPDLVGEEGGPHDDELLVVDHARRQEGGGVEEPVQVNEQLAVRVEV